MDKITKLAEEVFMETLKEVAIKKLVKHQKKRRKIESAVIYDASYKLLPEPEVTGIINITPKQKEADTG